MNTRIRISIILVILSVILAFIPVSGKYSLHGRPDILLKQVLDPSSYIVPDQVARMLVNEDSTLQLIDLRSKEEYRKENIPGSINLPYNDFLNSDLDRYLNGNKRTVFYSQNDLEANYAYILACGMGYRNCFVMEGGLTRWYADVMNSDLNGNTITARENALFEIRYKARKIFHDINSLPDSMKLLYLASKEIERKKLDGGCE